ncbi:unnamed protein product [Acanthosepion pharaonis]|uniref:Uncharacterized protein n=1 Tax=Acanthosepion pharaonis TaxID=158019 RepID=A0A812C6X5_ACAPH|nr:unnamed protein product [Sepia pharaonis]
MFFLFVSKTRDKVMATKKAEGFGGGELFLLRPEGQLGHLLSFFFGKTFRKNFLSIYFLSPYIDSFCLLDHHLLLLLLLVLPFFFFFFSSSSSSSSFSFISSPSSCLPLLLLLLLILFLLLLLLLFPFFFFSSYFSSFSFFSLFSSSFRSAYFSPPPSSSSTSSLPLLIFLLFLLIFFHIFLSSPFSSSHPTPPSLPPPTPFLPLLLLLFLFFFTTSKHFFVCLADIFWLHFMALRLFENYIYSSFYEYIFIFSNVVYFITLPISSSTISIPKPSFICNYYYPLEAVKFFLCQSPLMHVLSFLLGVYLCS